MEEEKEEGNHLLSEESAAGYRALYHQIISQIKSGGRKLQRESGCYIMPEYDFCARCGSGFSRDVCSQFCSLVKQTEEDRADKGIREANYDSYTKHLHFAYIHKRR